MAVVVIVLVVGVDASEVDSDAGVRVLDGDK